MVEGAVVRAGVLGVVREPRVIRAAAGGELVEDGAVGGGAPVRGHGLVHGLPGDVVAEAEPGPVADEQSGGHQLVEVAGGHGRHGLEQVRLDPRSQQGGGVQCARGPESLSAAARARTASRADGGTTPTRTAAPR